ncbi:hypothetical protein ACFL59_11830 [Planctomycetota bacterium]
MPKRSSKKKARRAASAERSASKPSSSPKRKTRKSRSLGDSDVSGNSGDDSGERRLTVAETMKALAVSRSLISYWLPHFPKGQARKVDGKWQIRESFVEKLKDPVFRKQLTRKKEKLRKEQLAQPIVERLDAIDHRLNSLEELVREVLTVVQRRSPRR